MSLFNLSAQLIIVDEKYAQLSFSIYYLSIAIQNSAIQFKFYINYFLVHFGKLPGYLYIITQK